MKYQHQQMLPDYSPFTPGSPVPIELFVGRENELRRLSDHLNAASKGIPRIAFLSGERGIGKSSIAAYIKHFAERRHSMAAVQVLLGGADTVEEMVRRTFESVLYESNSKNWTESIKDFFAKTVKSMDLFGLKLQFSPDEQQLEALTRNFAPALKTLIDKLQKDKKAHGLLLILDNINGLADSLDFANWFKSLADNIMVNFPMPLCIILVGIEERRASLAKLNPSLARVFDLLNIAPWNDQETRQFFLDAFKRVDRRIADAAIDLIASSDLSNLCVERKNLLAMMPESEHQIVSNFIQRMKKLGVLLDDNERERGCYRFSSHILLVYLFLVYRPEVQRAS